MKAFVYLITFLIHFSITVKVEMNLLKSIRQALYLNICQMWINPNEIKLTTYRILLRNLFKIENMCNVRISDEIRQQQMYFGENIPNYNITRPMSGFIVIDKNDVLFSKSIQINQEIWMYNRVRHSF